MKAHVLAAMLLMALTVSLQMEKADADGTTETLVLALAGKIVSLFRGGDVTILGHSCPYRQVPQIRRWQLYYKVKVNCPAFPGIEGEAHTRNKKHALGRAVEDFLRKALNNGAITKQKAAQWLERV